jgi:hypothetical protein
VSAPADGVDWDAAERRERRRDLLAGPLLVGFFVGIVLLTGGLRLLDRRCCVDRDRRLPRARRAGTHRRPTEPAAARPGDCRSPAPGRLRAHADPGPELRGRADQQARYTARTAWVVWTLPLGPLGLVIGGDWDSRPVAAAVGAALVVGAAVAYGLWTRARLTQARRWLADPPGPPREAPPPTAAERWSTGRRVAVVVGSVFVLAVAAGFVLAVTD